VAAPPCWRRRRRRRRRPPARLSAPTARKARAARPRPAKAISTTTIWKTRSRLPERSAGRGPSQPKFCAVVAPVGADPSLFSPWQSRRRLRRTERRADNRCSLVGVRLPPRAHHSCHAVFLDEHSIRTRSSPRCSPVGKLLSEQCSLALICGRIQYHDG